MTLEAVYLHRSILVTGATKMIRVADARQAAIRAWCYVTVNATHQAMLLGSDALDYCVVAMHIKKQHMISSYDVGRLNTLFSFGRWNLRQRNFRTDWAEQ